MFTGAAVQGFFEEYFQMKQTFVGLYRCGTTSYFTCRRIRERNHNG
jgi:hypothetical protein